MSCAGPKLVLLLLLPGLWSCAPPMAEIPFSARARYEQLAVDVQPLPNTFTHLVYGKLWDGREPIHPRAPGAAFQLKSASNPQGFQVLISALLPSGGSLARDLPVSELPQGEGVLQLVATPGPKLAQGPIVGLSRAYVVHRSGRGLSLQPFGDVLVARDGLRCALTLILGLGLLLGLRFVPLQRLRAPRLGLALVVLVVTACLTLRLLAGSGARAPSEQGSGPAPLFWPLSWELGGDGWERLLGPGFRGLWDRTVAEQARSRELIYVRWRASRPLARRRAVAFLRLNPGTTPLAAGPLPTQGLLVSFGLAPKGDVLLETQVGSLARLAERRGR